MHDLLVHNLRFSLMDVSFLAKVTIIMTKNKTKAAIIKEAIDIIVFSRFPVIFVATSVLGCGLE